MILEIVVGYVNDESLTIESHVVESASLDETVTIHNWFLLLICFVVRFLTLFVINDWLLNADCLIQEVLSFLKLVFLQVNAAQIVHATALFLSIL